MNTILVPTDFSDTSKNALKVACAIAKRNDASILIYHTYGVPHSSSTVMIDLTDVIKDAAEKEMKEFLEDIQKTCKGVDIDHKCVYGQFLDLVIDKSKEVNLIVMGTSGASGMEEIFLGSNTANLIKEVETPILAIPSNFEAKAFKRALISLDTNNKNTQGNVEYLVKMMTILGIENTEILNIQKEDETDEMAIEGFIKKVNTAFGDINHKFTFLGNDDIEKAILNHAKKNDLIVVLSKSYNFFAKLFHKSISKKLAMHSQNPLLVIKEL